MSHRDPTRFLVTTLFELLAWVLGRLVAPFTYFLRHQEWDAHVLLAARRYGLEAVPRSFFEAERRRGSVDGALIEVVQLPARRRFPVSADEVDTFSRLVLRPPAPFPYGIDLSPTGLLSDLTSGLGLSGRDILTGDPRFDEYFVVKSKSEAGILGLLDYETREALLKLYALPITELRVHADGIELSLRHIQGDHQQIMNVIALMIDVYRRLNRRAGTIALLRHNLRHDHRVAVRRRNLELLAPYAPAHEEAGQALEEALGDPDLDLRMAAAKLLGRRGAPTLMAVARSADATRRDDALWALVALHDPDLAPFFRQAAGQLETLGIAAEGLGALQDRESVPLLIKSLRRARVDALRVTLLHALGRIGDERAAPAAIDALLDGAPPVVEAAIVALAGCGGREAVVPLRARIEAGLPGDLRDVALRSIARIQGRLGGAEPGWLSIADIDPRTGALGMMHGGLGGALAIARHEGGSLELSESESPPPLGSGQTDPGPAGAGSSQAPQALPLEMQRAGTPEGAAPPPHRPGRGR